MYEQLDGILAWGDLISVSSAASQKHYKIQRFCYISRSATDIVQNV